MHGLINRAVQCFVRDIYGIERWSELAAEIGVGPEGFEAMLCYDGQEAPRMIAALARMRGQPAEDILEDLGTYLVTHENTRAVRRLLRFGGASFAEFLFSLDDLPDRARLAVPELELPALSLAELGAGRFELTVTSEVEGFGAVLAGILRALADDYGALALLEFRGSGAGREVIGIELLDTAFAEGKRFTLGGGVARLQESAR